MTLPILGVDWETHSEADIKKVGSYAYLTHPSTKLIMLSWKFLGYSSPRGLWWHGQPCPPEIIQHAVAGGMFCGWNAAFFERVAWKHIAVPRHGFPPLDDDQWHDTMLDAAAANLPRSLEKCGEALGAATQKDKDGHRLVMKLTRAHVTSWEDLWSDKLRPELIRFGEYCVRDQEAEEAVKAVVPPWPSVSPWVRMPAVDRRINDRGILLDMKLVSGMRQAADLESKRLNVEIVKLTNGQVPAHTNVGKLKEWLLRQGVKLPAKDDTRPIEDQILDEEDEDEADGGEVHAGLYRMRKNDMIDLLAGELPGDYQDRYGRLRGPAREAIAIRQEAAKASARKLAAMEARVSPDDRLRGAFTLGGAQMTMRWASGGCQVHNLIRNVMPDSQAVDAYCAHRLGRPLEKADKPFVRQVYDQWLRQCVLDGQSGDPDLIRMNWGDVLPFVSRMSRRCIAARPGYVLLQGDFAQVEARITAWLSGHTALVQAFASGQDVYRMTAAPILTKLRGRYHAPEDLSSEDRQIGKVSCLALGFLGGAGVYVVMSSNYGIRISFVQAQPIVQAWRETNQPIMRYGYGCFDSAANAVAHPGRWFPCEPTGFVEYGMIDAALCARLPSGRLLRYWAPRIGRDPETDRQTLSYISVKGRSHFRKRTWGGSLLENQAQGIGADLLAGALDNMDRHGELPVMLHVHDSADPEVPEDDAERLLPEFKHCMLDQPACYAGLPIGADVHYGTRFG